MVAEKVESSAVLTAFHWAALLDATKVGHWAASKVAYLAGRKADWMAPLTVVGKEATTAAQKAVSTVV